MSCNRAESQEPISYQALLDEIQALKNENQRLRGRLAESVELKSVEDRLRESESRYRMLFTNMTEGFFIGEPICDKNDKPYNYRYLDVNPASELTSGLKKEELLGKSVLEVFPDADPLIIKKYCEVALSGKSIQFETFSQLFNQYFDFYVFSPEKGKFAVIFRDITERKQMEKKLQESEEKYRTIVETVNEGILVIDAELRITYFNEKMAEMLGYSQEEIIGRFVQDFADEEDKTTVKKNTEKKRQGINETYEFKFIRKDGSPLWTSVNTKSLLDKEGKFMGTLNMVTDITRRKETEEALMRSESKFRTLAENSPDMIVRTDGQSRLIYVNPVVAKGYGRSQKEMIGKTLGELGVDPERVKFWEEYHNTVFDTKESKTVEFQYISSLGKKYYFNTLTVPEFIDGEVVSVLDISRDLSNIKEIETKLKETLDNLENIVQERTAELHEAYTLLKESEKSLAESQEIAHIGSWDWDIVTNKVHWSDETYRIFELNPQELEASFGLYFSYVHPDDRESIENEVKEALKGKTYSIDYRIILPNGERTVHSYGKVTFDENNVPIRMKGTTQDITERKRAEEALYKSEMRLRRFYELGIVGVFYYKMDGSITEANNKFLEMVGYTRDDLHAGRIKWDKMTPPEYRPLEEYALAELKANGMATPYEKEYTRKDGSRIPIILGVANIEGPRDDGIAFVIDATERKKAEEALAKIEIARKQEIHHRIKNNLQVISSLLDLQAEKFRGKKKIEDSQVLEAFKESQDRVISMALIHEELHKGGKLDTLNFSHYIEELADNLLLTYRLGNDCIILDMDIEEGIFFDMDTAVPLGIIINELVSNCLKHAFKGRDEGEIRIKLYREEYTEFESEDCEISNFVLTISDNGVGIPELDIEDLDSLGMQLITTLVDQLDGVFELKRNNGTEFTMSFAVKENNSSETVPAPELIE